MVEELLSADCFAIFSRTPTAAEDKSILVPPALTKGSGMPFVGRTTVTTPILIAAWSAIVKTIPPARSWPNLSLQRTIINIQSQTKAINRRENG